jgi:hypothetical protein
MPSLDNGIEWMRRRERALARAVLALFCLAWLQVAALPCAMAHAPAVAEVADGHCAYCPTDTGAALSCDEHGGCAYPHEPRIDARAAAPLFVAMPAFAATPFVAPASQGYRLPAVGPPEDIPRPSLSVRYCRYLE